MLRNVQVFGADVEQYDALDEELEDAQTEDGRNNIT